MKAISKYMFTVMGGLVVGCAAEAVAQAILWTDSMHGLIYGGAAGALFIIVPLIIFVLPVQALCVFLVRKRFTWIRALMIASPPLMLIASPINALTSQSPRHLRATLAHYLGAPLPQSVEITSARYSGGMDPTSVFSFSLSAADCATLLRLKPYELVSGQTNNAVAYRFFDVQHANEYYLTYERDKTQATLKVMNY